MMRVLRAFFKALQLTLRGESLTPAKFRPLEIWIATGRSLLSLVIEAADAKGVGQPQRQALQLKLDGRMTSLQQTLDMLHHNFVNEYPRLIRLNDNYSMLVVQSINMNDQYRLSRFLSEDVIESQELRRAIAGLHDQLLNLPTVDSSEE